MFGHGACSSRSRGLERWNERMRITIGSDHGAVALKEEVKMVLKEYGDIEVTDVGTFGTDAVDYPDIAAKVCADVASGKSDRGIALCGTGIGISIACNKIKGIRAAVCSDEFSAKYTRLHNDANILCMGARVIGAGLAIELTDIFLSTGFEGGRHQRRVDKITALEEE